MLPRLPSTSRRAALYHSSATTSAASRQPQRRRPEFTRDEVPHSGRTAAPERRPRVDIPDRSGNSRFSDGPPRSSSFGERRPSGSSHLNDRRGAPRDRPSYRADSSVGDRGASRTNFRRDADRRDSPRGASFGDRSSSGNSSFSERRVAPRDNPSYRAESSYGDRGASRTTDHRADYDDHRFSARRSSTPILDPRTPPRNPLVPASSPALSLDSAIPTYTPDEFPHASTDYDNPEDADEFFHPLEPVSTASTPKSASKSAVDAAGSFTSPPLLPGFVASLKELLGPSATPTPIQSLSIAHCVSPASDVGAPQGWKQFLLASETGSGKSIAYLLPLLQGIKIAEGAEGVSAPVAPTGPVRLYNPRGLVLAPTHELARQLAVTAKSLLHEVKLRVVCTSRANGATPLADPSRARAGGTASKMAEMVGNMAMAPDGTMQVKKSAHPVSVLVGTPMKLLEMVRGRGWDRAIQEEKAGNERGVYEELKIRRGRDKVVHFGTWRAKPELGLANVEWVVVDEADVLFDPDFQETTRTLLADISAARGHVLPPAASEAVPTTLAQAPSTRALSSSPVDAAPPTSSTTTEPPTTIDYPFHLLLTSATIPKSLAAYLAAYHPRLVRLASPRLHRLPKSLQTEYVAWTGGRKEADVVRRLRRVWAEDASGQNASAKEGGEGGKVQKLSQVLIFCNRSTKAVELAAHLEAQGIKCAALTSRSAERGRGSNRHLAAFLRGPRASPPSPHSSSTDPATPTAQLADPKTTPHVLITTSLLSRGLDFSPAIKHVFIVDEPRNTVDFLHRAGRTGRAGAWGKVVVFGKMKGRGAERGREVRRRVGALTK
ncbi:hypothetical protein HYPSUDRAFT_217847 [Hypholoma sublateritium FD-334 SS-4]|uniref:RNA helicase n=1 Tax=Hypholoma sublateritium (strain FD-334 SS-4) TaxID=945553 RepID=A0A0D2PFS9_HYPSF|nr:hypothetical protein HYPSUDRAFT_217847 [Hypholoma sublateritium FD-334 SS-4]